MGRAKAGRVVPTACVPAPEGAGAAQSLEVQGLQEVWAARTCGRWRKILGAAAGQDPARAGWMRPRELPGPQDCPGAPTWDGRPAGLAKRVGEAASPAAATPSPPPRASLGSNMGPEPPRCTNSCDKAGARRSFSSPFPGILQRPAWGPAHEVGVHIAPSTGTAWHKGGFTPPPQQVLDNHPPRLVFLVPTRPQTPFLRCTVGSGPAPPDPFPCFSVFKPNGWQGHE